MTPVVRNHLRIKVDSDEVSLFVANNERLRKVETARLVDASNPALVDLCFKAAATYDNRKCYTEIFALHAAAELQITGFPVHC